MIQKVRVTHPHYLYVSHLKRFLYIVLAITCIYAISYVVLYRIESDETYDAQIGRARERCKSNGFSATYFTETDFKPTCPIERSWCIATMQLLRIDIKAVTPVLHVMYYPINQLYLLLMNKGSYTKRKIAPAFAPSTEECFPLR